MTQGHDWQQASPSRLSYALLLAILGDLAGAVVGASPSSEQHSVHQASTAGLSIAFSPSAVPLSIKNAQGHELLGEGSPGFTLYCSAAIAEQQQPCNQSTAVPFDTCIANGSDPNTFTFGVSASGEELDVTFGGANHYLTANITSTRGFKMFDGKSVKFALVGKAPYALHGIGLNFMIDDSSGEGHSDKQQPMLMYEAPWVNSSWNPHARFAIYERIDDATEDETLFDLWVDEGMAHPRVNGSWDRPTAKAWIEDWTKANYDISHLAMVPHNLSEWRDFFPYAKLMDAKSLWFNFREWAGSKIDNVDPKVFPSGVPGFKRFSDDAAKNGFRITTHRMSGGLMPDDPDYCVKPDPGLLGWGNMHLVSDGAAGIDRIIVKPQPGTKIPILSKEWKSNMSTDVYQVVKAVDAGACSIGDEMLFYQNIAPLRDGTWQMVLRTKTAKAHPTGSLVRGYIKGNEYFIPDLFSPLYEEIAVRYANFSNLVGFDDGSFDGAAWFGWYGRWGFFKFATLVYENLDHPTAVHTSGLVVSSAWPEYRFNSVKAAFGGSFTTQPGAISLQPGYVGLDTPSLDHAAFQLTAALVANTRQFSVGHDLRSTLDVYSDASGHGVGNAEQVLAMVKEFKRGSLAMAAEQRQHMIEAVYEKPRGKLPMINATWMIEGAVYRKWVNTGTKVYDHKAYSISSYIPPRFYAQSGKKVALVPPAELQTGFNAARVIGRVLPRFDALSPLNFDLFEKMKVAGPTLHLSAHNPTSTESWDERRLKEYHVSPALNLTQHQGIGMYVDGDGSGSTLVVRVVCGNTARDYAVPLTFIGKQWVEIPSSEQGLRVSKWGPIGKGAAIWAGINFAEAIGVSIGIGYMPPLSTCNVTVSGLQALSEIREPLVNPDIIVGDKTVRAIGTLQAYDHFMLTADGSFTIFDKYWKLLSNNTVGTFNPTNLASFQMGAAESTKQPVWLEVGVAGGTETVPNPGWV